MVLCVRVCVCACRNKCVTRSWIFFSNSHACIAILHSYIYKNAIVHSYYIYVYILYLLLYIYILLYIRIARYIYICMYITKIQQPSTQIYIVLYGYTIYIYVLGYCFFVQAIVHDNVVKLEICTNIQLFYENMI